MAKTKTTEKKTTATEKAVALPAEKPAKTSKSQSSKPQAGSQASKDAAGALTEDKVMRHLKLHGKEFTGTVISDKMHKTVVVEWSRRRLVRKFERYEKRYSRVYAHNPITINAKLGDTVRVKETRPLSKTKNFVVVEVVR